MPLGALKEQMSCEDPMQSPMDEDGGDMIAELPMPKNRRRTSIIQAAGNVARKFSVGTIGLFQPKALSQEPEEAALLTLRDVSRARNRVMDFIHQTDVLSSSNLNSMIKVKVLFKAENFQKSGTYKVRGLLNHMIYLREQRLQKKSKVKLPQNFGVMTYTPGEFAEAAACAANMAGIPCLNIMPKDTCRATKEILSHYKASVIVNSSNSEGLLQRRAEKESKENGYVVIKPFDPVVMAGYGTMVSDFMKQTNNTLEAILVIAGDGTLAAATAITVKEIDDETDVYLVTAPDDPMPLVMATGAWPDECAERATKSLAPALNLTTHPSTRQTLLKHCEKTILTVDNNAISDAMRFIMERLKVVVDENSAACVAALFSEIFMSISEHKEYRRVGVMLTGGNCDLQNLTFLGSGHHDATTKCRFD